MLIKVCGMREPDNIRRLQEMPVDWIGLIFYPPSPRFFTADDCAVAALDSLREKPHPPRRVGVFVNASAEQMMETATRYRLDYLQLHGNESPDTCYALQKRGYAVIKAFPIASEEDLLQTEVYEGRADYFLFDTKCSGYGGSGRAFDWQILASYHGATPFLLSGGIRPESLDALLRFSHPRWVGIDLNSGFEIRPGEKDIDRLRSFITSIKS